MPQIPERYRVDPLLRWKTDKLHLPLLADIARERLFVPAALNSSERMFSQSGNIIASNSQNLDPTTFKKLTHKSQL